MLFVSFEAVSTGTYVMTAFHKTERTLEASTKYFFTGAVSTSIIVLGISYFYEATGTFYLSPSPAIISPERSPHLTISISVSNLMKSPEKTSYETKNC